MGLFLLHEFHHCIYTRSGTYRIFMRWGILVSHFCAFLQRWKRNCKRWPAPHKIAVLQIKSDYELQGIPLFVPGICITILE